MVICNACRYCEGYCAVFQAMEQRVRFPEADLNYLANLCHNCGECLYACQYAPPHEFNVNVPRTLAQIRLESYETYAWPAALSRAFRTHSVTTSLALSIGMMAVMLLAARLTGTMQPPVQTADFYRVLPHHVMIGLFGSVFAFVVAALAVGVARFRRDIRLAGPRLDDNETRRGTRPTYVGRGPWRALFASSRGPAVLWSAVRDALTLRNLHAHGTDCTHDEEARTPWRRWFHHCTFYGFMLCFAATSVAAIYHWLGWPAPYGYTSVPVVLGTLGGFGLLIGPAGLYSIGRWRDAAAGDPLQQPLDRGFMILLFLSSLTGLLLLVARETGAMPALLVVHLGVVLAFFVTMPYGKFVHGVYRTAALVQHAMESQGR